MVFIATVVGYKHGYKIRTRYKHGYKIRTKEFLRDESSRTKEFLSSRCAGAGEVLMRSLVSGRTKGRPNKGTVEQRDSRTKGRSNKGTGANYPPLPAHANEVLITSLLC